MAAQQARFLQKAINLLHSLPSVFRKDIPELGPVADHRAFWVRQESTDR